MLNKKLKDSLLVILSALLLVFSFSGYNLWFFACFAFVPLFFALKDKSKNKSFFLAYLTGVIFWLGAIYWLAQVTFLGLILLVLYLALYFGVFGLVISFLRPEASGFRLLFLASLWVILEYLRAHLFTGFGWALLGYSQYLNLPLIQIADITGVYGVSFLVMITNLVVYSAMSHKQAAIRERKKYILPILCIIISLIYGYYKIYSPLATQHLPLRISIIQGNIPQELKWEPEKRQYIMNKYFFLSTEALADDPDLLIWPEAAFPAVLKAGSPDYKKLANFSQTIDTPLLLGAPTLEAGSYYNSALLFSKDRLSLNQYKKIRLVPFGEYIPLKKILSFLETVVPIGDFSAGKEYTLFYLKRKINWLSRYPVIPSSPLGQNRQTDNEITKFGVLICFEDTFPELSRQFVKKGAQFLVNITNDAWFGRSRAPYQHLQSSVLRAVENRRFLVRAANTGISGFINPKGQIIATLKNPKGQEIFISGYQTERVLPEDKMTFYASYGDIFVLFISFILLCGIIGKSKFF